MHLLGSGIDMLMADEGITDPRFRDAATTARAAFADYQAFLTSTVRANPTDGYGCGGEAFEMYMRLGHELDTSGDQVERYAREQFAESHARLVEGAAAFGAPDWHAALAQLADLHPSQEGYYQHYQHVWDACRATASEHDLLTWPEYPIRFVPQPRWAREAAPYLYFLFYRSPVAVRPPSRYTTTSSRRLSRICRRRSRNAVCARRTSSVIKLNHVVHHGGIGHHVQNWYAFRAASRIGQMAAVDCASRIAMFCGGTMAEGWSSYVVDLMGEVGFLTPLEVYSQHYARMRAAARAIVDVNLHHGRLSLDEAIAFYRDDAGMTQQAAHAEAVKNSMFPGAAMIYLIGQDAIRDLRRDIAAREGQRIQPAPLPRPIALLRLDPCRADRGGDARGYPP